MDRKRLQEWGLQELGWNELLDACPQGHADEQSEELAALRAVLSGERTEPESAEPESAEPESAEPESAEPESGHSEELDPAADRAFQTVDKMQHGVQRFDGKVRAAFHDITVPAGLAERLERTVLAAGKSPASEEASRQSAEQSASTAESVEADSSKAIAKTAPSGRSWRRLGRRVAMMGGGLAVAAAAAGLVWMLLPRRVAEISPRDLAGDAIRWTDAVLAEQEQWQPVAAGQVGLAQGVRGVPHHRFQVRAWGTTAEVYDVSRVGHAPALLFKVPARRSCPIRSAPFTALPTPTSRYEAYAWETGGYVYVLVLVDPDDSPREFLDWSPIT